MEKLAKCSLHALMIRVFFIKSVEKCVYEFIEFFWLEGTFKGHLVQLPCREQGHLQLDQVAQSSVQPDRECFQGWGTYSLQTACVNASPPSP